METGGRETERRGTNSKTKSRHENHALELQRKWREEKENESGGKGKHAN